MGGLLSEGAGQYTKGATREPYARVFAPFLVPAASTVGRIGYNLAGRQFSNPDQTAIAQIGRAFERDKIPTAQAEGALNEAANLGVREQTLADVGGRNTAQLAANYGKAPRLERKQHRVSLRPGLRNVLLIS